ncbi:hypothetical protein ACFVZ3_12340 [Kitasatospora purpeofusca]|uniref:hypothetical protein n=1 Tax=Kitasatospora purpeofusca TaxID=67352 RepID=UPI0036B9BA70
MNQTAPHSPLILEQLVSRPRSPQRPPTHGPGPAPEQALAPAATGPDGLPPGPGPSGALGERAGVPAGATGPAVAVLHDADAGAPLRIDATADPVDGETRCTAPTAHDADGVTVCVRAHLPSQVPAVRVPLLEGGSEPRVETVTADGTVVAVRSTYADGTVLWLLEGRVGPDAAARTVVPGEPTTPGPEVFVRVDGCTRTAQQRRTAGASARVVDLWGARSRTLVLVTPGRPQGPAPRILLASREGAHPVACGTGALR